MAIAGPSVRLDPEPASAAGPAHVVVVSFLASRLVPSGGFWVALAGGVALARVAERRGARQGFGASIAATLETVAIIGPLRFGVPLTQAVTAPLLGRLEARGWPARWQMLVCGIVRLAQNSLQVVIFIWVIAGGLDAYAGTYEAIGGWLGFDVGTTRTLVLTAIGLLAWATFASVVQVLVYRRGLRRWDEVAGAEDGALATDSGEPRSDAGAADGSLEDPLPDRSRSAEGPRAPEVSARFDPRLLASVAVLLFGVLLASTSWLVLGGVAAFLALAWAACRPDPMPLRAGLVFSALLAFTIFVLAMVAGLGLEVALRRALRAALLVMTATWLRASARAEGLRFVFRRALRRLRRVPSVPEASELLDSLSSESRLAASGRAFAASLRGIPHRPVPFVDAVLGWVVREARAAQTGARAETSRL